MKLNELTITYGRKQSTGNYSNIDIVVTATVQPGGESDAVAALRAMAFCRNHVLREMSGPFPALRQKIEGLSFDLDGELPVQSFDNLPEDVQQAMVENGIDPDTFIYSFLPQNVEAELVQGD